MARREGGGEERRARSGALGTVRRGRLPGEVKTRECNRQAGIEANVEVLAGKGIEKRREKRTGGMRTAVESSRFCRNRRRCGTKQGLRGAGGLVAGGADRPRCPGEGGGRGQSARKGGMRSEEGGGEEEMERRQRAQDAVRMKRRVDADGDEDVREDGWRRMEIETDAQSAGDDGNPRPRVCGRRRGKISSPGTVGAEEKSPPLLPRWAQGREGFLPRHGER